MKEFVELIIKSISKNPDDVVIKETIDGTFVSIDIVAHPDDIPVIIGKGGKTIRSIRSLAKAKAILDQVKVNVNLVEI